MQSLEEQRRECRRIPCRIILGNIVAIAFLVAIGYLILLLS